MARPLKDGVDYWAFDVTLLQDRKFRLIRSEFGVYGVYIALELLNLAYREHGYYAPFDEEDCLLLAESIGGCAPDLIRTVAAACCRRGLFDAGVFEACGVLTSAGIQRRYLKIVAKNRAEIRIIREYWLLDAAAERDVPAAARAKLVFIDAGQAGKPRTEGVSPAENAAERAENPQRKENKRKQKQSRSAAPRFTPPSPAEVEAYCRERGSGVDPARFIDYYTANGWRIGRGAMRDWRAAVRSWERNAFSAPPRREPAYGDLQQYEDYDIFADRQKAPASGSGAGARHAEGPAIPIAQKETQR